MSTENLKLRKEILDIQNDKVGWEYLVDVCKWVKNRENDIKYDYIPFDSNIYLKVKPSLVVTRIGLCNGYDDIKWYERVSNEDPVSKVNLWCTPFFTTTGKLNDWRDRNPLYWTDKKTGSGKGHFNEKGQRLVYSSYSHRDIHHFRDFIEVSSIPESKVVDLGWTKIDLNKSIYKDRYGNTELSITNVLHDKGVCYDFHYELGPQAEGYKGWVDQTILLSFDEICTIATM